MIYHKLVINLLQIYEGKVWSLSSYSLIDWARTEQQTNRPSRVGAVLVVVFSAVWVDEASDELKQNEKA